MPQLCNTFNIFLSTGEIPSEFLEAVITTIHKSSKLLGSRYHPISLLNTDLKLYTKLQATRLGTVMPSLIHLDQVGFTPSREASDGTRRFLDLIYLAEQHQTPSLLISLDAEKASIESTGCTWNQSSKSLAFMALSFKLS